MVGPSSAAKSTGAEVRSPSPVPVDAPRPEGNPLPLTPDAAADIARKHGLSLLDAAGLLSLADDEADADRIAAKFATTNEPDTDAEVREYAAALFGRKAETPTEQPEPVPGHVPAEGTNPAQVDTERDVRRFVADLFDHPNRDHI